MKKDNKKATKSSPPIFIIIMLLVVAIILLSPKRYSITTGLYNKGTEEDQKNVLTALGTDNTEERFKTYFWWYNVVHELGHGLLAYNDGVILPVVDEEQLVNDFAVAYWKYYGEEEKIRLLEDITNYAVINVGTNYQNNVDYMELGRKKSTPLQFYPSFFNFNDYGWFQFSSVKHSLEMNKDLETVLTEMGIKNFKLPEKQTLIYEELTEETSDKIINDAIKNFKSWGLKYPKATHHFSNNPNNNYSKPIKKVIGIIEVPDLNIIKRTFKKSNL